MVLSQLRTYREKEMSNQEIVRLLALIEGLIFLGALIVSAFSSNSRTSRGENIRRGECCLFVIAAVLFAAMIYVLITRGYLSM